MRLRRSILTITTLSWSAMRKRARRLKPNIPRSSLSMALWTTQPSSKRPLPKQTLSFVSTSMTLTATFQPPTDVFRRYRSVCGRRALREGHSQGHCGWSHRQAARNIYPRLWNWPFDMGIAACTCPGSDMSWLMLFIERYSGRALRRGATPR